MWGVLWKKKIWKFCINICLEAENTGCYDICTYLENKGEGFIDRYIILLNVLKRTIEN